MIFLRDGLQESMTETVSFDTILPIHLCVCFPPKPILRENNRKTTFGFGFHFPNPKAATIGTTTIHRKFNGF